MKLFSHHSIVNNSTFVYTIKDAKNVNIYT